jgi:ABC-type branched-subunit amino acid transport system substrate-binding protein
VPVIAFSTDATVAARGVYLLSFLPSQEVPRIVAFAASRGKRRLAALIPDDAYGKAVEASLTESAARAGLTIAVVERYPADANGMLEPANRIKEAIRVSEVDGPPIDALFIPASQDALARLGPIVKLLELDPAKVKLLGTSGWDSPHTGRESALVGCWFANPDPTGWRSFAERYMKAYGSMPPRLASLAYDAVSVAAALAGGPPAGRFTEAALTRSTGFSGIDGPFRFLGDGTSERGLAVLEVQAFGAIVADAPPSMLGESAARPEAGAPSKRSSIPFFN